MLNVLITGQENNQIITSFGSMSGAKARIILIFAVFTISMVSFGQNQMKIDTLLSAIETGEKDTVRVNNLYSLAVQYYYAGDYDLALRCTNEMLELAEVLDFAKGKAKAHKIIGQIHIDRGDYEAAMKNFQASLNIYQEIGNKLGVGSIYLSIGNIQLFQNNYTEGLNYYYRSLEIALEINDKSLQASLYGNIGSIYKSQGNYTEALKNLLLSLELYEEIGDKRGAAVALANVGQVNVLKGNYPEALSKFLAQLKLAEEIGNKQVIANANLNVGVVFGYMQKFSEELYYTQIALRIYQEIGNKLSAKVACNNIGTVYMEQGNSEEALEYFQYCLKISEELNDKEGMASAFGNISKIYNKQGHHKEALKYYNEALNISRTTDYSIGVSQALLGIAYTYKYMGNYKLAREYGEEGLKSSIKTGSKLTISNCFKVLSIIDSAEGRFAQALENYKFYVIYNDSLLSQESNQKVEKLKLEYETEKKDHEIELLNHDNEIKSLQLSRQRAIRQGMIAGVILLFIAGFFLFRSFRLRKKLEQQKAIIGERKRISADLHDDVGSGLSRIMLLTELVKNEAKTPEMHKEAEKIATISKELSANISEIIWALNANNDFLESLLAYIRRYAAEFFDDSSVSLKINSTGTITGIPISGELRREIFFTVKEALHNIFKHSQATEAELGFSVKDDILKITIHDNGIGMPEKETGRYGNGLTNMQQRMESAGGSFTIENHQGTKITLAVPVR